MCVCVDAQHDSTVFSTSAPCSLVNTPCSSSGIYYVLNATTDFAASAFFCLDPHCALAFLLHNEV